MCVCFFFKGFLLYVTTHWDILHFFRPLLTAVCIVICLEENTANRKCLAVYIQPITIDWDSCRYGSVPNLHK